MIVTLASAGPRDVAEGAGHGEFRPARRSAPRRAGSSARRAGRPHRGCKRLTPRDHDARSERWRFGPAVEWGRSIVARARPSRFRAPEPRRPRRLPEPVEGGAAARPRRSSPRPLPPAPAPPRAHGQGGRLRRAPHRPLLQDDAPDAAPAVMAVHALDHERREMLHFEGEGALDPHHQARRSRAGPPVGARGPARHSSLSGWREAGEALADDLRPGDDDVGGGKALRREAGPMQASIRSARGRAGRRLWHVRPMAAWKHSIGGGYASGTC